LPARAHDHLLAQALNRSDTEGLRWVVFAILVVVTVLGSPWPRLWRQERAATVAAGADDRTVLPPEQHFPMPLIGVHGLLALTTLVLVLLTAFGIGD
jgi:hypothetical protein